MSFFGPVSYFQYDKMAIFLYMSGFLILFSIGYVLGIGNPKTSYLPLEERSRNFALVLKVVKLCLIIFVSVQTFSLARGLASGSLNLSVSNLGVAYNSQYEFYERNSGSYSLDFILQTLTYLPYYVSIILGVYLFRFLPYQYRILVVYSFLSVILLQTIGAGKQKQIGDMFIVLITLIVLQNKRRNLNIRLSSVVMTFVLSFVLMAALVFILSLRYEAGGVHIDNISDKLHPLMTIEYDHAVFNLFGGDLGLSITLLSGYFSQGYYGLSLAMQESFVWTYMVGNSYSLTVFLEQFFNLPLDYQQGYAFRAGVNSGWGETKWYTAFAWFAGDFTFIGTLFFFSFVAYLYASVWRSAMVYRNPIAVMIFLILTIGLLYIPANNQMLHTPGSVLTTFILLFLWFKVGNKFNFPREN